MIAILISNNYNNNNIVLLFYQLDIMQLEFKFNYLSYWYRVIMCAASSMGAAPLPSLRIHTIIIT